jgi:hypothetical protein
MSGVSDSLVVIFSDTGSSLILKYIKEPKLMVIMKI